MQEMKSIHVSHKAQPLKMLHSHPQDHAFATKSPRQNKSIRSTEK